MNCQIHTENQCGKTNKFHNKNERQPKTRQNGSDFCTMKQKCT